MSRQANKKLLQAVLEPRKPGAIKAIGEAIEAGADPNSVTPDTSTSVGHVPAGRTLLTHCVHEGASVAAEKLLQCGADASLRDELGWTPWMASTLTDESKRGKIQGLLEVENADKTGESIGELVRAVYAGNVDAVRALNPSEPEFRALASFRVDLLGHQVRGGTLEMLKYLLDSGWSPTSTNFLNAVRADNVDVLDAYLVAGAQPERKGETETPLMTAASIGNLDMVKRLVAAGADVNRYADEDGEWTPAKYARSGGHEHVAEWLESQMSAEAVQQAAALKSERNPKFMALYDVGTAAEGLSTDDIVRVLEKWDARYGLTVDTAKGDTVKLTFAKLPEDLSGLIDEAIELCPDLDEFPEQLPTYLAESRQLTLWWD